uniref:Ubiquitin-like-conjugating enzyme ATG10 n=1 Tax=Oryza punctata TaxID=4537 RepID=A0A0E0MMS4_ORYPU
MRSLLSGSSPTHPPPDAAAAGARTRRLPSARPERRRGLLGLTISGPSRLQEEEAPPLGLPAIRRSGAPPSAPRFPAISPSTPSRPLAAGHSKIQEVNLFGGFAMGGSFIRDGTLSLGNFVASAKALIEKWEVIDVDDSLPDWQWKPCSKMGIPSEEEGYLALEGVYRNPGGRQEQIDDGNNFDDADIVRDDSWVQSSSENLHVYNYHVVYSFSYKVPVLYFQGHHAGGQLLTLDEIKEDLPSHSLKLLGESKWTFITREEHPHFSRPWFTLHPCGTSDCMKLLLEGIADKDQQVQYLPAWLSVVGQAVGLKIPLELYGNL